MLFNILLVLLAIYVMVTPYFYATAVKFGMKIAQNPEKASEEKILDTFSVPKKPKEIKMTPQENRNVQILANIDAYNGTAVGQKKVEVDGF